LALSHPRSGTSERTQELANAQRSDHGLDPRETPKKKIVDDASIRRNTAPKRARADKNRAAPPKVIRF